MSDSDSDDDLFASVTGPKKTTSTSSILDGPRERKATKRLVDEEEPNKEDDEFDLSKLAAKSSRNTSKAAKMGFSSRFEAIESALGGAKVDWDFVDKVDKAASAESERLSSADPLANNAKGGASDDEGEDEEERDTNGLVRNVYSGGRVVLSVQGSLWPKVSNSLVFDEASAVEELVTTASSMKEGKLGGEGDGGGAQSGTASTADELCRKLRKVFAGLAQLSSDPCSAKGAEALTELLMRHPKGLPDALALIAAEAAASTPEAAASSSRSSTTAVPLPPPTALLPQRLWRWLLDLAFFHPSDAVGAAAAMCLERILGTMPPLSSEEHGGGSGSDDATTAERLAEEEKGGGDNAPPAAAIWEPARPLDFASVCRVLCCLGLDPTADDPTSSSSSSSSSSSGVGAAGTAHNDEKGDQAASSSSFSSSSLSSSATTIPSLSSSSSSSDGTCVVVGLASPASPGAARFLYPPRSLKRVLEVFALCLESGRHRLDGTEALDLLCCVVAMGADTLALATPGFTLCRERLLLALLALLSSDDDDDGHDGDSGDYGEEEGGDCGAVVRIWPDEAERRLSALVRSAGSPETKVLLLRALPATGISGLGAVGSFSFGSGGGGGDGRGGVTATRAVAAGRAQRLFAFAAAEYAATAFPPRAASAADAVAVKDEDDDEKDEKGDYDEKGGKDDGGVNGSVSSGSGTAADSSDNARCVAAKCAARLLKEYRGEKGIKRELARGYVGLGGGVAHLHRLAALLDLLVGVASAHAEKGHFGSPTLSAPFVAFLEEVMVLGGGGGGDGDVVVIVVVCCVVPKEDCVSMKAWVYALLPLFITHFFIAAALLPMR
jgi:hypothetical protein